MGLVHHFSEDGGITSFVPHVPRTNPTQGPAVWAIDADHAPLYWFPRDCPRVTAWPRNADELPEFEQAFGTTAPRVHVIEYPWLPTMLSTQLFRYDFDITDFTPWPAAFGQWIAHRTVEPVGCQPVGDLVKLHRAAGIELRVVESLLPVAELANDCRWGFSIVRLANAGTVP